MDTTSMQRQLTRHGFNAGSTNGILTPLTINAIKMFQRAYNGPNGVLVEDGDAGPLTQAALDYLPLLSPHFSVSEVACKHCGQVGVRHQLLGALEVLRNAIRRPLNLASVYRCPIHNAEIGGAKNSMHPVGAAADIELLKSTVSVSAVKNVQQFSGIGTRNNGAVASHVDVRHLMNKLNQTPNATPSHPEMWTYPA